MVISTSTKSFSLNPWVVTGIVFVVLKLTGTIDWSWWAVLAPFWLPFAIVMGAVAIVALVVLIMSILGAIAK